VVLAGTFLVLGVLPLVALTEIGLVVALGVLIDTLIVRSVLVPALLLDLGDGAWRPSRIAPGRAEQNRSGQPRSGAGSSSPNYGIGGIPDAPGHARRETCTVSETAKHTHRFGARR